MKKNHNERKMFYAADCILIAGLMVYTLLDTFVITRTYQTVDAHVISDTSAAADTENTGSDDSSSGKRKHSSGSGSGHGSHTKHRASSAETETAESLDLSSADASAYSDDNIRISITEYTYNDTQIYAADVQLSSVDYLYTAFAENAYGKNVTDTTSSIAGQNSAILAINGDFYGARNSGYVLRNGTLYRDTVSSSDQEDLVINADGSFSIITEGTADASEIESSGALQVFSFGPALIIDGEISVSASDEVGKAMASNPRTAICEIEPLHYLFVVADGRTDESEGLSLYELAQFLQENFDITTAYNLDGGGSSTMVFNGKLVNNPTTSGSSISERSVSDVICIGY
ncbi:MAG: phosphodiester glycosidase family protein [Solobacterium sp.]|nr:phosphodiester glycosidase family protein [Solobacterium sp.]